MSIKAKTLLSEFAALLKSTLQADELSLLLCTEGGSSSDPLLMHHGTEAPLPELADPTAIDSFLAAQTTPETGAPTHAVASQRDGASLVPITFRELLERHSASEREVNERRSAPNITTAPTIDGTIWVAVENEAVCARLLQLLNEPDNDASSARWLGLSAKLAWSTYQLTEALRDPVSLLHDRVELQLFLDRAIAAALAHQQDLSLVLINPDDFGMINYRYGREQGDQAIREIAAALEARLRKTDGVFRYAGGVFAAVLPATNHEQCARAVEEIRRHLTHSTYVSGAEHFTFSIGASTLVTASEPAAGNDTARGETKVPQPDAKGLLRCTDTALHRARLSGGGCAVTTIFPEGIDGGAGDSPLQGVFTTDTEKDYRNMLLLWETIGLVTRIAEPQAMAVALIDRLAVGFQPDRLVLLEVVDQTGTGSVLASNVRDAAAPGGRSSGLEVGPERTAAAADYPCADNWPNGTVAR